MSIAHLFNSLLGRPSADKDNLCALYQRAQQLEAEYQRAAGAGSDSADELRALWAEARRAYMNAAKAPSAPN